jgi:hypothetical protein
VIPQRQPGEAFDAHQAVMAKWAGYPDAASLNADHDRLHRAVCNWLGVESRAMMIAAGCCLGAADRDLAVLEEQAVLHLQRFMRRAGAEVPQ